MNTYACVKNAEGQKLIQHEDIQKRWQLNLTDIYNVEFSHPPISKNSPITGSISQITEPEVGRAIKAMKSGKSPGPDDIPAEFWKMKELHPTSTIQLTSFLNLIVDTGKVPTSWSSSTTIPIFRNKGDPEVYSKYRPIRLLSHTLNIFERIIDKRLCSIITLNTNQCGFVKDCGTIDAIHADRLLLEKHRE